MMAGLTAHCWQSIADALTINLDWTIGCSTLPSQYIGQNIDYPSAEYDKRDKS